MKKKSPASRKSKASKPARKPARHKPARAPLPDELPATAQVEDAAVEPLPVDPADSGGADQQPA